MPHSVSHAPVRYPTILHPNNTRSHNSHQSLPPRVLRSTYSHNNTLYVRSQAQTVSSISFAPFAISASIAINQLIICIGLHFIFFLDNPLHYAFAYSSLLFFCLVPPCPIVAIAMRWSHLSTKIFGDLLPQSLSPSQCCMLRSSYLSKAHNRVWSRVYLPQPSQHHNIRIHLLQRILTSSIYLFNLSICNSF